MDRFETSDGIGGSVSGSAIEPGPPETTQSGLNQRIPSGTYNITVLQPTKHIPYVHFI
jgi:hypothetical protein